MTQITFCETEQTLTDGQQNINELPPAMLDAGFVPKTAGARGQPLAAQYLNWLFQKLFRLSNRDKVSDKDGVGLFVYPDSIIEIVAFDKDTPANVLHAVGYKLDMDTLHTLTILTSNVLTLGTPTIGGNQPISGGANVIIKATSRQFGDI